MAYRPGAGGVNRAGSLKAYIGRRTHGVAFNRGYARLEPARQCRSPLATERAPKEGTFAGFATFKNALPPGRYTVNLSAAGWIDVVQDGQFLRPVTSSGVRDCEGIRKSVKFELRPKPFVLQISGVEANSISLAIVRASE